MRVFKDKGKGYCRFEPISLNTRTCQRTEKPKQTNKQNKSQNAECQFEKKEGLGWAFYIGDFSF